VSLVVTAPSAIVSSPPGGEAPEPSGLLQSVLVEAGEGVTTDSVTPVALLVAEITTSGDGHFLLIDVSAEIGTVPGAERVQLELVVNDSTIRLGFAQGDGVSNAGRAVTFCERVPVEVAGLVTVQLNWYVDVPVSSGETALVYRHATLRVCEVAQPGGDVPPAPGSSSSLIVANGAALAAINDTLYPDGARAQILTLQDDAELRKGSALTADGITVWATLSSVGRWVRCQRPSAIWQRQIDWAIDPLLGNDEHAGTTAAPLLTAAELQRRLGMWGQIPCGAVINVLHDLEAFRLSVTLPEGVGADETEAGALAIIGACTQLATGVLTAHTPLDRTGAGTPVVIETSIDMSAFLDKLIRLTSGDFAGYSAWLVYVDGTYAELTPWVAEHTGSPLEAPAPPIVPVPDQPTTIAIGDAFEVLDVASLGIAPQLRVHGGGQGYGGTPRPLQSVVVLRYLRNTAHNETTWENSSAALEVSSGSRILAQHCDLSVAPSGAITLSGCLLGGGAYTSTSQQVVRVISGGTRARTPYPMYLNVCSGHWSFDGDFLMGLTLCVGALHPLSFAGIATARLGRVFIYCNGDGLRIASGSVVDIRPSEGGVPGLVYGNCTSVGVRVDAGGRCYYGALPAVNVGLGLGRELRVGGVDLLWSAAPNVNLANLACLAEL